MRTMQGAVAGSTAGDRDLVSLLSLLSHDLRGPLGPLVLAVSTIADADPDPDTTELARFAEAQAQRIARLIDAVLWVARGVEPEPSPVSVEEIARDAAAALVTRGVRCDVHTVEAFVEADATLVRTGLTLLADRAADEGGEVRVGMRVEGEHVGISIAGAGWSGPEPMEPLASARALSVAAADAVARAHGGRLDVTPAAVELWLRCAS